MTETAARTRVLVVDDEADVRELCRVNLEFAGYDVLEAGDGLDALDVLARQSADVVLLDLMMPRMDGWAFLRHVKEDNRLATIPVVLLTARTAEEDQILGLQEGAIDYIAKPFNPLTLAEQVEKALRPVSPEEAEERRERILEHLRLISDLKQTRGKPPAGQR